MGKKRIDDTDEDEDSASEIEEKGETSASDESSDDSDDESVHEDSASDDSSDESDDEDKNASTKSKKSLNNNDDSDSSEPNTKSLETNNNSSTKKKSEKSESTPPEQKKKKKKKIRKLELKEVENFNEKLRKRGVIYIARVPPAMGPAKVKSLLSDFGEVTRVYLVEEDASARKRRKRAGGHGAKRYTEGWVEYADGQLARKVAQSIHNTPITNYKRSKHYGDLWSVKYLRKFRWDHLTEKVAYERRVREQKLMVEMMAAKRENAAYASLVEAGKKMDGMEAKKRKKAKRMGMDLPQPERKRHFRQTAPLEEQKRSANKAVLASLV